MTEKSEGHLAFWRVVEYLHLPPDGAVYVAPSAAPLVLQHYSGLRQRPAVFFCSWEVWNQAAAELHELGRMTPVFAADGTRTR